VQAVVSDAGFRYLQPVIVIIARTSRDPPPNLSDQGLGGGGGGGGGGYHLRRALQICISCQGILTFAFRGDCNRDTLVRRKR